MSRSKIPCPDWFNQILQNIEKQAPCAMECKFSSDSAKIRKCPHDLTACGCWLDCIRCLDQVCIWKYIYFVTCSHLTDHFRMHMHDAMNLPQTVSTPNLWCWKCEKQNCSTRIKLSWKSLGIIFCRQWAEYIYFQHGSCRTPKTPSAAHITKRSFSTSTIPECILQLQLILIEDSF